MRPPTIYSVTEDYACVFRWTKVGEYWRVREGRLDERIALLNGYGPLRALAERLTGKGDPSKHAIGKKTWPVAPQPW